jgi:PEP-CTERM motif
MKALTWTLRFVTGALFLASVTTHAAPVYEQPWNSAAADAGAFSDLNQRLAGQFMLSADATITGASWFGTMFSSDPLNTGDSWGFHVEFRSQAAGLPDQFGMLLHTNTLAAVTDTGIDIAGERAYRFDATWGIPLDLDAGVPYWFSALNAGSQSTFRWTEATTGMASALGTSLGSWVPLNDPNRTPLNFTLHATLNGVPEPTALALITIALAGFAFGRRRNSKPKLECQRLTTGA